MKKKRFSLQSSWEGKGLLQPQRNVPLAFLPETDNHMLIFEIRKVEGRDI